MSDYTDTRNDWLQPDELADVRGRMPIVYVNAIPVRVEDRGIVTEVGLLLQAMPDGSVSRSIITGRVLYGELVRDALVRHLEKDLGRLALPRVPPSATPFTVAEYFPNPDITGFHDPRQHAVGLSYVIPVDGDCEPSQSALDLAWLTPAEAVSPGVVAEMTAGHDRLVRRALAHAGVLP